MKRTLLIVGIAVMVVASASADEKSFTLWDLIGPQEKTLMTMGVAYGAIASLYLADMWTEVVESNGGSLASCRKDFRSFYEHIEEYDFDEIEAVLNLEMVRYKDDPKMQFWSVIYETIADLIMEPFDDEGSEQ
jgi:hypothetical protein